MSTLADAVHGIATDTGFSGVVAVHTDDGSGFVRAYGLAHRGYGIPADPATRFALASVTKGFTACTVISLVAEGVLTLDTPARTLLGADLPLISDDVTVEHLLAHRSGIGDYVDEETAELGDPLAVGFDALDTTEDYLPALDGFPAKFPPDERFSYCNGGYVVLALLAQRAAGTPFATLATQRVFEPAGMTDTAFLRSDELPGNTAAGYLEPAGLRTNVFALPVRGSGDGGAYSTVADLRSFWRALFAGAIVPPEWVARMVRPRSDVPQESLRYGMGFWLPVTGDQVILIGGDAGVSCWTLCDPGKDLTATVMANTAGGAWPIARHLKSVLAPD